MALYISHSQNFREAHHAEHKTDLAGAVQQDHMAEGGGTSTGGAGGQKPSHQGARMSATQSQQSLSRPSSPSLCASPPPPTTNNGTPSLANSHASTWPSGTAWPQASAANKNPAHHPPRRASSGWDVQREGGSGGHARSEGTRTKVIASLMCDFFGWVGRYFPLLCVCFGAGRVVFVVILTLSRCSMSLFVICVCDTRELV